MNSVLGPLDVRYDELVVLIAQVQSWCMCVVCVVCVMSVAWVVRVVCVVCVV